MSDDTPVVYYDKISICAGRELDEDEESVVEYFEDLAYIDLPDGFMNRTVNLDSFEPWDSSIWFAESTDEDPSEADNHVEINESENNDKEIHFHLRLDTDTLSDGKEIWRAGLEILDYMNVGIIVLEGYCLSDFDKMAFPISDDDSKEIMGIRYVEDDRNYLIQKAPEETVPDDEEGGIYVRMVDEDLNETVTDESYIDAVLDRHEQYLSTLEP